MAINSADPSDLSITSLRNLLAQRELSAVELVQATLERIHATDQVVHAFVSILEESAIKSAKSADKALLATGESLGPLHGIPYTVKDNIDVAGEITGAGSKLFANRLPAASASCVRRADAAGAVLIGKVTLHELAYSQANIATRNPWRLDCIAGPSSAGSAAAVATGMGAFSIGTDTGGSVRIPAALCGVVGFKPTFGRIGRTGIVPLAPSLDNVGALARCMSDCKQVVDVLSGFDREDEDSTDEDVGPDVASDGIRGLRIGAVIDNDVDTEIVAAVREALTLLEASGASVEDFELAELDAAADIAAILTSGEAASYHGQALLGPAELLGDDVRRRLMLGSTLLASDYIRAQRVQAAYRRNFASAMDKFDLVLLPTTGITAPETSMAESADVRAQLVRFTTIANVLGAPSITIPARLSSGGLPIGIQLLGRPYDDVLIASVAGALETMLHAPVWSQAIGDVNRIPDRRAAPTLVSSSI